MSIQDARLAALPSRGLAAQKAGNVSGKAGGFGDEQLFEAGHALDQAKAKVARRSQRRPVVGEEAIERIECSSG